MDSKYLISKINEYLYDATQELAVWLGKMLPRVSDEWWEECVLSNLSEMQRKLAEENGYTSLEQFDLSALLTIANKSWYDLRTYYYLPASDREIVRAMKKVRNNWAHCSGTLPGKDRIANDISTINKFFKSVIVTSKYERELDSLLDQVTDASFELTDEGIDETEPSENQPIVKEPEPQISAEPSVLTEIKEKDRVYLTADPDTKGMVFSVDDINGTKSYQVFVNGELNTYFDGQIVRIDDTPKYTWIDIDQFQTNLTAYEINNPSAGNLYSLNAARIDFVPYQFRPALKLIKSDEPKILIADSVGVGKTIEAGLIIKELEARSELDNILIICPKPLVSERKWELEMKRFDEEFTPLDGPMLRQIISDTDRDGEWTPRLNKCIIPYSILDSRVYEGEETKRGKKRGLVELDPAPHFDLVIIDEAHHIRNGSLEKEQAYAYKCVRYFCEHADAVVMLTATPLQTSNDDLYTLLNLLRPDVVMDKEVFEIMSKPNAYIYSASHIVRGAAPGWQYMAADELRGIASTQWGSSVICNNPLYSDILNRLNEDIITREERVKLVTDIESLHSFGTMLNRTRRKDIQDFCVRRSHTIETSFTERQLDLHNELLNFERAALSQMHDERNIPFMMSTIRRQAASCIFGLAPYIKDIINRRFVQILDDPEVDIEREDYSDKDIALLKSLAQRVLNLAENLPEDDPKFDSLAQIVLEKQKLENNKIILFSTFRHTLHYLKGKLEALGIRVAQIDGSVKDEARRDLRERFEMDKSQPEALDMLLFTEVGSEGLDYQFCDMMINYDLPWNPMKIEQRIGRIDRRGQKSEVVNIYNLITAETVDADIYTRCLMRIGIFERSIGECEEVLGSIGSQIEQIAINTQLTDEERKRKLEQIADNEVRKMQELSKLEDEEHALFGFDLSNYTAAKEIKDAESPWISPKNIQRLIERYFNDLLGVGQYITGNGDLKQLNLSKENRAKLREDFRKLSNIKSAQKRKWELYLKGTEPRHKITFVSEAASKDRKAFFITPMHPLVKQAAKYYASSKTSYIHLTVASDELSKGQYYFSIYAWSYVGINPGFKVVPICENKAVETELIDLIQDASTAPVVSIDENKWRVLDGLHLVTWQKEKQDYIESVNSIARFRLESLTSSYRNRKRSLEQKIHDAYDFKIRRMYQSELNNATIKHENKVAEIQDLTKRADIHTTLIAKGVIEIR